MIHLLVFNRANMPPLMGKFWYPLLFDYMRDYPTTLVPGLPWTLQHSKRFYISWDVQDPFLLSQHDRAIQQLGGVDPRTSLWANTKVYYGGDISAGRGKKSKTTQGQRLWN
ncbi:uncharacterized protein BKA55DRAFT_569066 [Fusarium redolens]|uniref:Uncharacterized protein n=1 Tax=Fusarium redolens TaxID=48865 RepID=A0A9P9H4B6_FUSRE|nr:uncharacterized protein BKA55DRAFT_569066 [Fusarium redolens]KAH7250232.1 hypothetical protein BKA55DRAFT_569066 [Fusarium redolens]